VTAMRLGLAQGLLPADPDDLTPALAARIRALGVSALLTHFQVPPAELRGPRGRRLTGVLQDAGLTICQYAGLRPTLITSDGARRGQSIDAVGEFLRTASFLGAGMVVTGCGSHHPGHPYGPARQNHSQQSRDLLVASLTELAGRAADAGTVLAMEAHCLTTLDTPETVRQILDAVDSPWVRVNFDPVNFLASVPAVYGSGAAIRHAAEVLGPRLAPAAHVKDVVLQPDLVLHIAEAVPGDGLLDLPAMLDTCRLLLPHPATLIVEHLGPDDAARAIAHVTRVAAGLGIELG
jgi:sugar phosphate isomerase/epimerase